MKDLKTDIEAGVKTSEGGTAFLQPPWPQGSNILVPDWGGAPFAQAISLGSFCHAAWVLKQCGFRRFSGPFDWIFCSPEVTAHALGDDFACYLDRSQYEPVPEEKRVVAEANLCDHRFYRDRFGLHFMFNHHLPTTERDYLYLQRCVERFRAAMADDGPKLLLLVTQHPLAESRITPILSALDRFSTRYLLLAVRFFLAQEDGDALTSGLHVTQSRPNLVSMDFPVRGLSNGVEFADPGDNQRFIAMLKSFKMADPRALSDREPENAQQFDEDFYLATHPDVAKAVREGQFLSGWQHFCRHGRMEGRLARIVEDPADD